MEIEYHSKEQLLNELRKSKSDTLPFFDFPKELQQRTYAPGKWNVKQLLHHITDAETVLYERIRRAIAKPGQTVYGFDQDAWAEALNYHTMPLIVNKRIYRTIREGVIYLVENFYNSHGQNAYNHNETGARVLKQEMDKVAWHNRHHLKQIHQALGI